MLFCDTEAALNLTGKIEDLADGQWDARALGTCQAATNSRSTCWLIHSSMLARSS